jgi:hypothetical protein
MYRHLRYTFCMKPRMKPRRKGTSIRLTETALRLWSALALQRGITKTALLESVLREEAKREGIK